MTISELPGHISGSLRGLGDSGLRKMRNKQLWKPSKFVITKGGCKASRDPAEVGIGSRFMADIIAGVYERTVREHARGLLLDLGCGKIPLYEIYRDRISDCVCVDWPESLHSNPNIDHEFDLNHPIPLPDNHFDTILLTDVLEHLPNPWLLWKEISRLLKPCGKAIVGVPFLYWIHEAPYDYYRYTEHALRRFCDENGFNVVELESYGGPVEVILDIIAKQIRSYSGLSRLHYWFSQAITEFCTHRVSDRTRRQFPLGYCVVAQRR